MTSLVLELNDAGLTWTGESGVLSTEPGYAVLNPESVLTGEAALARAHLEPRLCRNRYWDELSADIEADSHSHAELAYLQLQKMFHDLGKPDGKVVLVTPGHYSREQLGLVLGIAQECGIAVTGLIEKAVAASSRPTPGRQLIYLDVSLHRLTVSVIAQDDAAQVERAEQMMDSGTVAIMDQWARRISELFVIATRFDPLHHGETEQRLYDALPGWVQQLSPDEPLEVDLDGHRLHLERQHFIDALDDQFRALAQLTTSLRSPGVAAVLHLSHRLVQIPGLVESLSRLDDCDVVASPASHVAQAVSAAGEHLNAAESGGLRLVRRLPWRDGPPVEPASRPQAVAPASTAPLATHLVYDGLAHPVSTTLVVGRSPAPGRSHVVLSGDIEGISAEHCEVQQREGELWLRDLSRYGTRVNGQRVAGEARLRPGDLIQIGSQTLTAIAMAEADGA